VGSIVSVSTSSVVGREIEPLRGSIVSVSTSSVVDRAALTINPTGAHDLQHSRWTHLQ
jgi:hypothetical protein